MTHFTGDWWDSAVVRKMLEKQKYSWYFMKVLDKKFNVNARYFYHGLVLPGDNIEKPVYTCRICVKNKTQTIKYIPVRKNNPRFNYACFIQYRTKSSAIIQLYTTNNNIQIAEFDVMWKGKDITLAIVENIILSFYAYVF